ncbi:uncharacterized protein LOC111898149 isoform X1 [Lactuca sativa]|uniref:uncharacterized protein LOC111898149 isoform X1 n=1 Tax=Lactuca sativa TaxID=4236 RepID=UPI000CD9E96C|nr:uncharacterized protein LOC111898149 isoform X1 [Lactuca sativa]XP_042754583.1 uncharacterized protein LOC111898149 isoform X1 [Lactuca sativa]
MGLVSSNQYPLILFLLHHYSNLRGVSVINSVSTSYFTTAQIFMLMLTPATLQTISIKRIDSTLLGDYPTSINAGFQGPTHEPDSERAESMELCGGFSFGNEEKEKHQLSFHQTTLLPSSKCISNINYHSTKLLFFLPVSASLVQVKIDGDGHVPTINSRKWLQVMKLID